MSKCTEIRDFLGDYAFDVEYSRDNKFTMFFNSRRNAETVKRCIEVDDSVPNAATPVDFVEIIRCKDCKWWYERGFDPILNWYYGRCERPLGEYNESDGFETVDKDFCSYAERK